MNVTKNVPRAQLYTTEMLAWSATLAHFPLDNALPYRGEAHSRTCGSSLKLGLDCDGDGRISKIGFQVTACAVGQSSAALLAAAADGKTKLDITRTFAEIQDWLKHDGSLPSWPGFEILAPVVSHPGRHGALLLAWQAAGTALSNTGASS